MLLSATNAQYVEGGAMHSQQQDGFFALNQGNKIHNLKYLKGNQE
jgi:hypothetical protein